MFLTGPPYFHFPNRKQLKTRVSTGQGPLQHVVRFGTKNRVSQFRKGALYLSWFHVLGVDQFDDWAELFQLWWFLGEALEIPHQLRIGYICIVDKKNIYLVLLPSI